MKSLGHYITVFASVPSMEQIELFYHLLRIIMISYLKPFSSVQIIYITKEYLINRITDVRINFYLLRTFCPHLGTFLCCSFFHDVSAKFHLWPSSGDLPRPRIGMLSLVTVSPVITAFHSCCLSHHVFDQVNLWPAWVGFETAIFRQCSPGTVETQRLYPLRWGQKVRNE